MKRNRGHLESDPDYTWEFTQEAADAAHRASFFVENFCRYRLASLMHDRSYIKGLTIEKLPFEDPFGHRDMSVWFGYEWALDNPAIKELYIKAADKLVSLSEQNLYNPSFRGPLLGWGSGSTMGYARTLLLAHHLTGNSKYKKTAAKNLGFAMGNNPLGLSFIVGLGNEWVAHIQDLNPNFPGTPIYGLTGPNYGTQYATDRVGLRPNPPYWKSYFPEEGVNAAGNEFTIHQTTSPGVFAFGYFFSGRPQNFSNEIPVTDGLYRP